MLHMNQYLPLYLRLFIQTLAYFFVEQSEIRFLCVVWGVQFENAHFDGNSRFKIAVFDWVVRMWISWIDLSDSFTYGPMVELEQCGKFNGMILCLLYCVYLRAKTSAPRTNLRTIPWINSKVNLDREGPIKVGVKTHFTSHYTRLTQPLIGRSNLKPWWAKPALCTILTIQPDLQTSMCLSARSCSVRAWCLDAFDFSERPPPLHL